MSTSNCQNGTGRPTVHSHEWNVLRDGPKGEVLCHICGGSGYPKLGAAERCDCTDTEEQKRSSSNTGN